MQKDEPRCGFVARFAIEDVETVDIDVFEQHGQLRGFSGSIEYLIQFAREARSPRIGTTRGRRQA